MILSLNEWLDLCKSLFDHTHVILFINLFKLDVALRHSIIATVEASKASIIILSLKYPWCQRF